MALETIKVEMEMNQDVKKAFEQVNVLGEQIRRENTFLRSMVLILFAALAFGLLTDYIIGRGIFA